MLLKRKAGLHQGLETNKGDSNKLNFTRVTGQQEMKVKKHSNATFHQALSDSRL